MAARRDAYLVPPPSARPPVTPLPPGTLIDGYRLGPYLGQGTEGAAYHAVERLTGVPFVLKVLHAQNSLALRRAGRVSRICHRLRGANVIAEYHRCGRVDGIIYLVFDYLDGVSLTERLARRRWDTVWQAEQARAMLSRLAQKLGLAHAAQIAFSDFAGGNNIVLIGGHNPVFCDLEPGQPGFPNRDYGLDLEVYAEIAGGLAKVRPRCLRLARIAALAATALERRSTRNRMGQLAGQIAEL